MASTISSSPSSQTPDLPNQAEDKYTAFVEKRLQQTAGHVKLVDLFGGLMFLLGGLIAGLLALAVVDAWLFELGSPVRLITLLVMIAVTGWFLVFRIAPLLMRRINPAYSAKMIEDGHPELKNSLINHVFFQQDPENARRIINRAMSRKAAEDISTVTIETAVDRSHMIRAAIFFVAALAIFGLYKVVSPKDPFKTVARIVAPLSDITRPSRVDISQIEPGDTEVFFGESVEVIAVVDGLGKSESAFVVYSTDDGQARDKRILMKSSPSDDRYRAILSTGDSGIQQSLTYRILAGDATSSRFGVAVKPRPSFVVQNVHIKPPAYTRLEPFSQKQGNVASVEGAEITVEALANLPVQSAFVQLLAVASEKDETSDRIGEEEEVGEPSVVESVPMIVDEGTRARGTFRLQMRGDHVTPRFTHYRVGFVTADGTQNNNPAVFRIRTTPDLKPEIEILVPEESEVTVAQNGVLKLTIRAIDPDYEVTDIRLVGDTRGVSLFDKTIFGENVSAPRVELFHAFRPDDFGLRAGQQVLLQSVALDNRQSSVSDLADPNRAKSRQILVQIGPPQEVSDEANQDGDEDQQPPDQENPQNKQDDSTQDQNEKQNDRKQSGKQDSDEQKDEKQGSGASESESNDQKQSQKEQPQNEQSQNEQSKKQESDSDSDSNKNQKKSEQSEQSESQESNSKQQNSGEESDSNSEQQSQSDSSDSSESGEQTGEQSNSGQSNNQTGESGSEPMKSDNKSGSSRSEKNTQSGDSNQADPTNSSEDQSDSSSSDPVDHPGEAFEKIKQHLEEKQKKDKQQQSDRDSSNDTNDQSESNDAASESEATDQQSNDRQSTGETKDQEDKQSSANDTENQQRPEDASASDSSESKQTESQDKGSSGSRSSDDSSQQQQDEDKSDNQQRSNSKSGEKKQSTEKGTTRENSGKGTDESQKKSQKQDADSQGTGTQRSESEDDEEKTNQQKNTGEKNGKRDDTQENGKSADSQHEDQASEDQTGDQKSGDQKSGDQKSGDQKSGDDRGKVDPANKDDAASSAGNSDRDDDKTGSRKSNDLSEQQESKDNKSESASQQNDRGEEAGSQRENRSDDKNPEKSGDKTGEDSRESETKSDSRDDSESKSQSSPKGAEAGKGDRDPDAATAADSSGDSPGGDDPNLEYSRKATEMVLDYLKDQEENPDRELLDELKWSEAEMRDFYQKWQQMREQAEKGGAAEQRSYEEALRSLGLSPQPEGIGQESIDQKKIDQLREDGTRSKPPAHLLEEFRSFNKERSRK